MPSFALRAWSTRRFLIWSMGRVDSTSPRWLYGLAKERRGPREVVRVPVSTRQSVAPSPPTQLSVGAWHARVFPHVRYCSAVKVYVISLDSFHDIFTADGALLSVFCVRIFIQVARPGRSVPTWYILPKCHIYSNTN